MHKLDPLLPHKVWSRGVDFRLAKSSAHTDDGTHPATTIYLLLMFLVGPFPSGVLLTGYAVKHPETFELGFAIM